jgi:hypothetical protein
MAIALVLAVLVVVGVAARLWVPGEFDLGAARAVALAGGVGLLASLLALRVGFGAGLAPAWALKVVLAVAVVVGVGMLWAPLGKLLILVKLVVLVVAFVGVIAATRAVTLRELRELRRAR